MDPQTFRRERGGIVRIKQRIQMSKVKIEVNGYIFIATIQDTQTGRAFLEKLPLTIQMNELNGNEKCCDGLHLPTADVFCHVTYPGDIMLFWGSYLVLFYGMGGGWDYTPIGKVDDTEELAKAVGAGNVSVSWSLIE